MPSEILSPPELWSKTVNAVKNRVNHRSLWETLEQAVAITIESDTLIIGLDARIFNLAGHLSVSDHRNAIQQELSSAAGRPLQFRVIEGTSLADWAALQKREERVAAMRETTYEKRDRETAEAQSWENIYEHAARAYSGTPFRQLPQSKARYLAEILPAVVEAMKEIYPEKPDEHTERLLARVIDKIASNVEAPASAIAYELFRLRAAQPSN